MSRRNFGLDVLTEFVLGPGDKLTDAVPRIGLVNDHGRANSTFSSDYAITISFDLFGYLV
jgi:hypothetical protein